MGSYRKNNLKVKSQSLGTIFIEPRFADKADIAAAKIVVYPAPFDSGLTAAVVEWAASTQVPFFCHVQQLSKLKNEGFGSYRFQKLDSFKEVDFLAGSIEFFPSRSKKFSGLRGWMQEVKEILGFKNIPGFHMIIKPRKEQHVLYLSHPYIDHIEWSLISKGDPLAIIGSENFPRETWVKLGQKFKTSIFFAEDIASLDTAEGIVEFAPEAEVKHYGRISQNPKQPSTESEKVI